MIITLLQQLFATLIKPKSRTEVLKGHIDVHNHFVIKPFTNYLRTNYDSFYEKILSNMVFFTFLYNCVLTVISIK